MRNLILGVICLFSLAAQAAEPVSPNQGEITLRTAMGTYLQGYVAGPEDAKLGILILPDRWGVDETLRQWVKRFGEKGYRALAIDVFDGRQSDKVWLATEILHQSDPEWAKVDMKAGLDYLRRDGRKLVTLGAGYGGWQSFQAALAEPDSVAATVVIYGRLEATVNQVRTLKAPLLAIYARDDEQVTAEDMEKNRLLMEKSLIAYRSYVQPAAHGYMDPLYPSYNAKVTKDTWSQVDDFLKTFVVKG